MGTESVRKFSNIFIVSKPNGRFRPIINLKYLNYFVSYEHFKQGYDQQQHVVDDIIGEQPNDLEREVSPD